MNSFAMLAMLWMSSSIFVKINAYGVYIPYE